MQLSLLIALLSPFSGARPFFGCKTREAAHSPLTFVSQQCESKPQQLLILVLWPVSVISQVRAAMQSSPVIGEPHLCREWLQQPLYQAAHRKVHLSLRYLSCLGAGMVRRYDNIVICTVRLIIPWPSSFIPLTEFGMMKACPVINRG